jgi:hypothetical protein
LTTAEQELASQLTAANPSPAGSLREDLHPDQDGPRLEKALKLAYDIKEAAPDQETILTVHGLKRLTRNATEPMTLSGQLQDASSSPCSRPHPLPAQHPATT